MGPEAAADDTVSVAAAEDRKAAGHKEAAAAVGVVDIAVAAAADRAAAVHIGAAVRTWAVRRKAAVPVLRQDIWETDQTGWGTAGCPVTRTRSR